MASLRAKQQTQVGSSQWIHNEREQTAQFADEQIEDFAFSARNDFEWLNEHMSEIFSENQINVTEIFKTPGKLRGKTPRTARKRNPLEARAPLTDIFSTDVRYNKSPSRPIEHSEDVFKAKSSPLKPTPRLQRQDENAIPTSKQANKNTDSGYHGLTEDEMDTQEEAPATKPTEEIEEHDPMQMDSAVDVNTQSEQTDRLSDAGRTTEDSFQSARENMTTREITQEPSEPHIKADEIMADAYPVNSAPPPKASAPQDGEPMNVDSEVKEQEVEDVNRELETAASLSDASTPEKPLVRKSSLTFASLPAREITKKSFGNRVSRTSQLETAKNTAMNAGSYFGRYTGGKSLGATRAADDDEKDDMEIGESGPPELSREESDGDGNVARMHSKSSTQRLHERINLLGKKQQPPRPTKSIPAASIPAQSARVEAPQSTAEGPQPMEKETAKSEKSQPIAVLEDDDDDWIMPPPKPEAVARPQLNKSRSVDVMEQVNGKETISGAQLGMGPAEREQAIFSPPPAEQGQDQALGLRKATSTTVLQSPSRPIETQQPAQIKHISVSNPSLRNHDSTTPPGSPPKSTLEGHLSASKSKLQSIMKSARGLFTSSAGASAQAKMETLSPASLKMRMQENRALGGIDEVVATAAASTTDLYPTLSANPQPSLPESPDKGRKTRSSTEKRKEKEAKDRQKVEAELEKAREQERQKASKYKEQLKAAAFKVVNKPVEEVSSLEQTSKPVRQSPRRLAKEEEQQEAAKSSQQMPPPSRPGTAASQTQPKGKEIKRPVKPAKETASKPKAPPVSIRVGTISQRVNSTMSNNPQESLGSSTQRPTGLTKKGSNASVATTSSFKSSASSTTSKPKALLAAERKKEQDEREAQRKQERQREIERQRAAAKEEVQRKEQKQREEAEKLREKEKALAAEQEAKRAAHKQTLEKKRMEKMRLEQQRIAADLAAALEAEKSQQAANAHRGELGPSKPPSRMDKIQDFPRPPGGYPVINTAKPPIKRVFDPEEEDELSRPARPAPGQNYQASEGKRRKTEDEDAFEKAAIRPAMAPPIRQSGIRKLPNNTGYNQPSSSKPSFLQGNYPTAPPPAHGHTQGQTAFKPSTGQQGYHPYGSQPARPAGAHPMDMAKFTNGKIPFADAPNPPSFKTPAKHHKKAPSTRPSPAFTNGEHIHLDDIPTDSEDEDSADERDRKTAMPDWVRTPNLFQNLSDQERLNPDAVFGPIAPLNMEEMFKDKSRHAKFRSRTSSANWNGADRLTDEEIVRDHAARQKMRRDGGWTYGLQ